MFLGCTDEWFGGWKNITPEVARRAKALGVTGLGLHFFGDPMEQSLEDALKTKAILEESGITICEFWGEYPSIITPDEALRQEGIRICKNIVQRASQVGALFACIRPTSMNPAFNWGAHPYNYTRQAEHNLITSLKEIVKQAEYYETPILIEAHGNTTLSNVDTILRIIKEVDSPFLRYNVDIVNLITNVKEAFETRTLIHEVFDKLSPYIVSVHFKDVNIINDQVVHISEALPGTGLMDWDLLLQKFNNLFSSRYGLVEHLKSYEEQQAAIGFINEKMSKLNLSN